MQVVPVVSRSLIDAITGAVEGEVKSVTAVDITFYGPDGIEIEPLREINVSLRHAVVESADKVDVVHLDANRNAEIVEQSDAATEADEVTFTADQFSIYALVETVTVTVDYLTADGQTYGITVQFEPDAGVPDGAMLSVTELSEDSSKYSEYLKQTAEAIDSRVIDLDYIKLLDIRIVDGNGNKVTLNAPVDVQIQLRDREQTDNTAQVVHFEGVEETPILMESSVDGDTVAFSTDGFSVYAVVEDGSTEDEARATVNFFGKDTLTPIATLYVKNRDTAEELEEIVYDPGCGQLDSSKKELFDGWVISTVNTTDGSSYTIETEGKTIEEVRDYLENLEIREGDVVNIYAKIVRTITVSYQGEAENTLIGSVVLKVLGSDDPNDAGNIGTYTISMAYTPATSTQAFMGWNVAEGASNILAAVYEGESATAPYQNGTTLTLKGDVKLSVNAPFGHWLVFDENGHGATYNAPQFVKDQETTSVPPVDMARMGYTFGGWWRLKDNVSITNVPKDADGYYIISDDYFTPFAFGSELDDNQTVYAKWTSAATANYTVIVWKERMTDTYAENGGTGEGKQKNYDFAESYTFNGTVGQYATAVSNGTSSVVDGDAAGTRYYNARIRGTDVSGSDVNRTISYTGYHCAGYDTDVEVRPEGTSVVNVYYDRNTVTYTFYTYGSSGGGTWWLCKENGDNIIRSGQNATSSTEIATRNGNNYSQYTGRVAYDDGETYYYSTTDACGGTNMREAHWEYKTSGSQWNVYQQSTGLYGEPLNWPTDPSIWWYENHNNTSGTGTRMTYKDAFLPLDSDMTVEYWGNTASASGTIHFWTQDVNGSTYTDQVQVNTGNANFSINDKFTGFYAYQYRTDYGNWQNVGAYNESTGIYGSPVSYNNRLDIRYNRISATITFLDGAYYDGDGNPVEDETPQAEPFHTTEPYFYGADVSAYNKGGTSYYTPPEKSGYTFAGWYADDACTVLYAFGTMPASGITVYAKWIQNQYRVFLHPNVPESDTSLNWGSGSQNMNFRVSSGKKVSAPTGTRTGYRFIGWYLDEACTEVFDASRFVLNDTTVTTPYDKTVDMTDVMNKYGNIEGEGTNSDAIAGRFWITRKLDLYAKWRAELVGAEGIGVKYDPNGGSNAPSDTTLYLDNTDTVAQGAPTPPDHTQQFLHWVMQKWDEEKGEYVDLEGDEYIIYPGASFTVLKANARIEELESSTPEDPHYRYTVQLRAEYGPKDTPTPTHLTWYANGGISQDGTTDQYTDPALQINEAVAIHPADTFKRDGYAFLGWARVDSTAEGYTLSPKELTEEDLFLKYDNGKFYAQLTEGSDAWTEVEEVAADEKMPYHDIYAVWEKKTYTVTVTKSVNGIPGDEDLPFTFTPKFTGLPGSEYTSAFRLVGNENGTEIGSGDETVHYDHVKTFIEVPYGTVFTITEQLNDAFNTSLSYTVSNADKPEENITVTGAVNGVEITANGDVALTVTNTRKIQLVRILKTEPDKSSPLGGSQFTVNVAGTDYTLTSDTDGYLKNETFQDGVLTVPYGTYTLTETKAPDGYILLPTAVSITVDADGVHAAPYDVKDPTAAENCYTVIVPNNPGAELPHTGGIGVYALHVLGSCLILTAAAILLRKRKTE